MKKLVLISFFAISSFSCERIFFEEPNPDKIQVFDSFFEEVERHYSFFDVISFETFQEIYSEQRIILEDNPGSRQLEASLERLVNYLQDGHTDVYGTNTISYEDWYQQVPLNQLADIRSYFSDYRIVNSALEYGMLQDQNVGYLKINNFSGASDFSPLRNILAELSGTNSIIIDVRSNGGGASQNSDFVTSFFNDQRRVQFRRRRRIGGLTEYEKWSDKFTGTKDGLTFTKPVFVLTNRKCFSSTEWFITGMMTIPYVQIVGDTTGGGSGNPIYKELPNGWSMRTSNTQKQLPSGRDFQFTGLYPDVALWITEEDSINGIDTILEKAIDLASDQ